MTTPAPIVLHPTPRPHLLAAAAALPQEPKTQPEKPSERSDAGTTAPGGPPGTVPTPNSSPQPCGMDTFLLMGLFLALMWFMVLRPESRRRKETAAMLSALKQGDNVVTIGGMHGQVQTVLEKTVLLRIGDQTMTFDRTAIARVVRDEPRPDKKP
jgi:preprotein translocase subunit YajC